MWLHNTKTLELCYFNAPEDVPGGYAILSHVWDKAGEQTFQKLQAIWTEHERSKKTMPPGIADGISSKIHKFCELARKHQHDWAWLDTSCINKESSAELSEGINSMFRYYALSDVCYVYMVDVSSSHPNESFSESNWHKRGWTLQELLAPRLVVFLDQNWTVMGTKSDFAQELSLYTSIPESVILFKQDIHKVSIAERMSWARDRRTTRAEDEAYCLMGIFGINMPTLYGEGRNAFYRLQEEIMRTSTDTSLFAWEESVRHLDEKSHSIMRTKSIDESEVDTLSRTFLFAPSPSYFRFSGFNIIDDGPMTAVEVNQSRQQDSAKPCTVYKTTIPTFTLTPRGVLAYAPVTQYNGHTLLLLSCSGIGQSGSKWQLALRLGKSDLGPRHTLEGEDPLDTPLYHVIPGSDLTRLIVTRKEDTLTPSWRSVYIVARPEQRVADPSLDDLMHFTNLRPPSPLRFSYSVCRELFHTRETPAGHFKLASLDVSTESQPWTPDSPPLVITLKHVEVYSSFGARRAFVTIRMGQCGEGTSNDGLFSHWVTIQLHDDRSRPSLQVDEKKGGEAPRLPSHSCASDHVDTWPSLKKTFESSIEGPGWGIDWTDIYITVNFMRCPINPHNTLLLKHFDAKAVYRKSSVEILNNEL